MIDDRGHSMWVSSSANEHRSALRRHMWRAHVISTAIVFVLFVVFDPLGSHGKFLLLTCAYTAALAILRFLGEYTNSDERTLALAVIDIVVLAFCALLHPALWLAVLALQVCVVSIGWMESMRATIALLILATSSMFLVGLLVKPDLFLGSVVLFAFGTGSISITALWSDSDNPLVEVGNALSSLGALVWTADTDGNVVEIAGPVFEMTGMSVDEVVGTRLSDLVIVPHENAWRDWTEELWRTGVVSLVNKLDLDPPRTVRTTLRLEHSADESRLRAVTVDISDGWKQGKTQRRHALLIEHMHDGLIVFETDSGHDTFTVSSVNDPAAMILNLPSSAGWREMTEAHPQLCQMLRREVAGEAASPGRSRYLARAEPTEVWASIDIFEFGRNAYAVQLTEITNVVREEARIRHDAAHDGLTGLVNAREFQRRLEEQLDAGLEATVFLLDLDRFKPVNDEFGHAAGDVVLQAIARRLANQMKDVDVVSRLGGDEFVGFLNQSLSDQEAVSFTSRLEAACAAPIVIRPGITVQVSASIGYAVHEPGVEASELVRRADAAMYITKGRVSRTESR